MVATFPSRVESARFNEKNNTVVLINPNRSQEPDDISTLSKSQLRNRLGHLQTRLQKAEETIHLMHDQMQTLSNRVRIAEAQPKQKRTSEPARQASTYVVPKRQRSQRLDRVTRSVPFYLLMVFLGIGLSAAVAVTMPMTTLQLGLAPFLMVLLKGIFVAIAFSTIGSFALEVSKYHAH